MQWVSLFVELLRTRPAAMFWGAALTQGALWTLVPSLFYSAPPGDVADFMAMAREWGLGTPYGPPLAYWLAEIAFTTAGLFGVYLLAQVCVVVTLWAVFALGCIVVGGPQAAMAVLLMAGVAVFTVPTPEFGPPILAMVLWSLMLLHYWRATGQGRRLYWIGVGLEAGLLILTTYSGIVLIALLLLFSAITRRGRDQFRSVEPLIAGAVLLLVLFPHLVWIEQTGVLRRIGFETVPQMTDNATVWLRTVGYLAAGHAGLVVLVLLARGFALKPGGPAAEVSRPPIDPDGRLFVLFFALVPALAIGAVAPFTGRADDFVAPCLVVLSGLVVIAMAPDRIRIVHQRLAQAAWAALLVLPPVIVSLAVLVLPWAFGIELRVAQPVAAMGPYFAENFERRTGRPLTVVTGDARTAALVALTAPTRPSVHRLAMPQMSPTVPREKVDTAGAVVVWPATTTRGVPPPAIQDRLPGLVPEVPRAFERRFQGRQPVARIGWSVMRPGAATMPPARQ